MHRLAKILQGSKTIHSNGSFLGSIHIKDFIKLELTDFKPINRNQINTKNYDKVNSITQYHNNNFINNNNYNTINGILTLNADIKNIYLIDGIHRYKAYNKLYNDYGMKDFKVSIEYWNVKNMDEVLNNYNLIQNNNNKKNNRNNTKKNKRLNIPKKVRQDVWNRYIGDENGSAKCYVCRNSIIDKLSFTCGHIEPIILGGKTSINNMRPICPACNTSMGTMNMGKYVKKYYPDNYDDFIREVPSLKYPNMYFNPLPIH